MAKYDLSNKTYYSFKMTDDGWNYLAWIGDRYLAPSLFFDALFEFNDSGDCRISESDAWEIKEAYEEEGGFTCLNPDCEFAGNLRAFIDSIV